MAMNPAWPKLRMPGEAGIELQSEREDAVDAGEHADPDPEIEAHEPSPRPAEDAAAAEEQRQDQDARSRPPASSAD